MKFEDEIFDAERERYEEAREEFRTHKRWRGCHDRMCGATDCPNCFPGSWDEEEQEENDEEIEDPDEKEEDDEEDS